MPIDATIVVPCHNHFELTDTLLSGLAKHEYDNINKLVIVDDASTEETLRLTRARLGAWNKRTYIITNTVTDGGKISVINAGFTISANRGLKFAADCVDDNNTSIIFLISNDVQVRGKFIQQTADILLAPQKHLVGNNLLSYYTGWNKFGDRLFPYLPGHFLAATAQGWQELGYFDEAYAPWDYEDMDLSTTAMSFGYGLTPLNNPMIVHCGGGSIGYNPEREAITRRNREYFRRKWMK